MKKIELCCRHCKQKYWAIRISSKFCSDKCRTAAYRVRKGEKDILKDLRLFYCRDGNLAEVQRELIIVLKGILDHERIGRIEFSALNKLRGRLKSTIDLWMRLKKKMFADQIEWIYDYVDSFLFRLLDGNEMSSSCNFRLTSEVRNGIEKLLGL